MKKKPSRSLIASLLVLIVLIPLTLWAFRGTSGGKFYFASALIIIEMMLPFFLAFERRRPQARELVLLAVLSALAVASRAAFIWLPAFKPMLAVIMLAGISFGPEAGFLVGAVSAFASNFIFGQGPWTPWQMFAYGVGGFLMALLCRAGIVRREKRLPMAIAGALIVFAVVGFLLDSSTFFMTSTSLKLKKALLVYAAGAPLNAIHAAATFVTLFLFGRPLLEKLDRVRLKYGMDE